LNKRAIQEFVLQATIGAIYFILVLVFNFISFEVIQFRIAEALLVLIFFNKKHIIGLSIGTLLANLLSPFGIIDALLGTLATVISLVIMYFIKKVWYIGLLIPGIINGIIIGSEITILNGVSIFSSIHLINCLWVLLGELVVMIVIGLPFYLTLNKNNQLRNIVS
jgi:uncharacterized membrane protein